MVQRGWVRGYGGSGQEVLALKVYVGFQEAAPDHHNQSSGTDDGMKTDVYFERLSCVGSVSRPID